MNARTSLHRFLSLLLSITAVAGIGPGPAGQSRAQFEIVGQKSSKFDGIARGHPAALQALVDAARKQLPHLPREEEARAARSLLLVDRRPVEQPQAAVDKLVADESIQALQGPGRPRRRCTTKAFS